MRKCIHRIATHKINIYGLNQDSGHSEI